jgi:exo-beta-1,3-glucanase (GH17 family)
VFAKEDTRMLRVALRGTLFAAMALAIGACGDNSNGGGGSVDAGDERPDAPPPVSSLRPLPTEFGTRTAVAYSGYRGATRDVPPTDAQFLEDLQLMHAKGIGLIRVFDTGADTQRMLAVLAANPAIDIKVMLGIWIVGPAEAEYATINQTNMDVGISVANDPAYKDLILAVSVGNETMIDWSFLKVPPADMAGFIRYVRDRITQPVTTDDNWAFFRGQSTSNTPLDAKTILDQVDFVSLHTYALADTPWGLWDWQQTDVAEGPLRARAMMDAAMVWTKSNFTSVRDYLDDNGHADMPIVIGETGWKSIASDSEVQRAHPINQKMFYDDLRAWDAEPKTLDTPVAIVYFEAFDEPWKRGDDRWGLWNVDRQEKYVLWAAESDGFDPVTEEALPASPNDDAEYYVEPVSSGPITASRYALFSDTVAEGEARPGLPVRWNAWENNATASSLDIMTDVAEGTTARRITPSPLSWGWGMALSLEVADNLTNFNAAEGRLNFSIKTTYPGKLEVGFFTGATSARNGVDAYVTIQSGEHGYLNDGEWHEVSIPIATIAAAAVPAYGQSPTAMLDMALVYAGFVIADRFAATGNPTTGVRPDILLDNIYWSK